MLAPCSVCTLHFWTRADPNLARTFAGEQKATKNPGHVMHISLHGEREERRAGKTISEQGGKRRVGGTVTCAKEDTVHVQRPKNAFHTQPKARKEKQLQQANRTDGNELGWHQYQRANAARNIGGNSFSQRKLPGKNVTLTRDVSCGGGVAHGAVHYVSERPARGHAAAQAGLLEQKNNNDCRTRLCCLHSTHKMPRNPHAAEPTPEPINASTNTAV